jgi:hypothetical protein
MFRKQSKIIAVFLLLVFSQKGGLRLWMHHWFHESKTGQSCSAPASQNLQLKCDCFDDAMMPLLESPLFIVPAPVTRYTTLTVAYQSLIPTAEDIFYSLKGPPASAI